MLLAGRTALVTGAASGIGRATAERFVHEGADVVAVDLEASQSPGFDGRWLAVKADVGVVDDVRRAVETAVDEFGRLDVIVSNAAAYTRGSAVDLDEPSWDRTLDVCLKATWALAHHGVPVMQRGGGGSIVVVASVHSIRGYRDHVAYQAAKAGLLGLTRSLAADFAPDVRANAVLPGAVVTGLWKDVPDEERQRIARMCLLRRNGEPEDVANAILFLASDMASYVTGTSLIVDGGLTSAIEP